MSTPNLPPNFFAGAYAQPNVQPSQTPFWGRAWKLTVRTANNTGVNDLVLSTDAFEPETLRCTFEVLESTLPSPFWYAVVTVYNLDDPTKQNLLFNAVWLTLEAGYQCGLNKSATIWDGPVLQVIFDRPHVVDMTMTFNCIAGLTWLNEEFINFSQGAQGSQMQLMSKMIQQKNGDVNQQVSTYAQEALNSVTYARGKTVFGHVSKFIAEMSDNHFLANWKKGNQNYLSELYNGNPNLKANLFYAPPLPPGYVQSKPDPGTLSRSIIGVPKQSQFGCDFEVLLDPNLKVDMPPLVAELDATIIQAMKAQIGNIWNPLDQTGKYVVAQVRHRGDTRGNDWYTTVNGVTPTWAKTWLDGTGAAAQAGVK